MSNQQIPKTFEDLTSIAFALSLTDDETLGKPVQADGKETGVFHFESSASSSGPFYDLVMGDPKDANFGKVFTLRVSLSRNARTYENQASFGFIRLANGQWMFADNVDLKDMPKSRLCPEVFNDVINNAFRLFYTQHFGSDSVPDEFDSDNEIVPLVLPAVQKTGMLTALEQERQQKELAQQKLEQEMQARREREERAQREREAEARRIREAREAEARREQVRREEQARVREEQARFAREAEARLEQARREAEARRAREAEARAAEARRVEQSRSAENVKLVSGKHWFNRIMESNNVQPDGTLASKNLTENDKICIGQFITEYGREVVVGWWNDYKVAAANKKSKIDF